MKPFPPASGQLYRNITGSPHKPFNPQTFSNALTHFSMLAVLVFGFYWLIRLCALPLYRKMGQWARQKNRERSNWLQLPAMIIGAFIIDLLLLALTLFVGQVLSDNLNCRQSHHRLSQQSLFLNAFALIEFFKAVLRLIFCPKRGGAAPVHDSGRERPLLESSPELVKQFDRLWPDCGRADYL
ncbi:membrane protein YbiO [Escherichia coli]|uniref:Membrane protein YbiO n=1 Tax=Escherichia coli TaxID=562 RepID=A0A2X1PWI8_ECOLX|nr:membrane protein YbiO [Escherichia coli]